MYGADESRDHLAARSPHYVYSTIQESRRFQPKQPPQTKSWHAQLIEWFFPLQHACPLPPHPRFAYLKYRDNIKTWDKIL
jgi:hypothetical protein